MIPKRLLLIICGAFALLLIVGGLLGAMLRLVNELRYALEYFLPYWLVNPLLLVSSALVLTLAIQFGWPWWKKYLANARVLKTNKVSRDYIPQTKRQAAKQSLESIDRLLDRLKQDVAKEGLKQARERVEKELARGDLVVVVFGTGSSGKTSLIRALLNEIVGEVGAPMGSTTTSQRYRLRLKGLDRGIQLIDTPGILEAGKDGKSREKEAKLKASRADIMLVVVDSDLREAELQVLESLAKLGKRTLLVLNKCDLRGVEEEKRLLALLKGHCKGFIDPLDVIPASASPQSLPRPGRQPYQPDTEIDLLLERLAKVLHDEGEELLADNILLQCQNLGEAGRQLLNRQRQKEAGKCVERYSWISSGVIVLTPLPGIDLIGTAAVNAQMVMEVAKIYGVQLTKNRAQELALTLGKTLAGLGIVKGGVTIISTALSLNLPTLLIGRTIQGIAAAWLTRIAGASLITYFKQDQDWGDGGVQEVVQHHYELNRRQSSLKRFLEEALKRVVEPIQKEKSRQLPPRRRPREEEGAFGHENQEL